LGFEPNDEGAFCRKVHVGIPDDACADKFDCENLVGVVATPKKWVAYLDQVRIELKIGPADPCGDFIDIFGTELGFFGKTDHRVPFDLQNAARRILSITEWTAKKASEILHVIVIACSHTDSHTEIPLSLVEVRISGHFDKLGDMLMAKTLLQIIWPV
jgi:hypothetical protein